MGIWSTILGFGAGYALGANKDNESIRRLRGTVKARVSDRIPFVGSTSEALVDVRPIREVMTPTPRTITPGTSLADAARVMAEDDIGDVLVAESKTERLVGIVTDRDIAIRAVAESRDPDTTKVKDVVSSDVVSVDPRDTVRETLELIGHTPLLGIASADVKPPPDARVRLRSKGLAKAGG